MSDTSKDTELSKDSLTWGVDKGSPNGDMTALTIQQNGTFYNFVGDEAEVILAFTQAHSLQERIDELKQLKETYQNNIVSDDHMTLDIHDRIKQLEQELQDGTAR